MSFFERAIEDWKKFWRAVSLMSIIVLFLIAIGFIIYKALPAILDSASSRFDNISYKDSTITFTLRGGREFNYLSVPAYQLNVKSGIVLEPQKDYIIKASGVVSTGDIMRKELSNILPNAISEKSQGIRESANLSWRYPDGQFVYFNDPGNTKDDCIVKQSESLRLDKNEGAEYGMLLALIVNKNEVPHYNPINFKLIRIGNGITITYDSGSKFKIALGVKEEIIEAGEIYFAVNDTIITNEQDFELPKNCGTEETKAWREFFRKLYKRNLMKNTEGIWYLNNQGHFNVSVEVKPHD